MLTPEVVRQLLDYDPSTGIFTWRTSRRRNRDRAGAPAGYRRPVDGRWVISINREKRLASVIAYVWMTGEWPQHEIDHKDRNPTNDRWDNLRPASRPDNMRNVGRKRSNASGFIGVCRRTNGRWLSYTRTADGRRVYLGHYATAQEAALARDEAARRDYGEFAVLNFP